MDETEELEKIRAENTRMNRLILQEILGAKMNASFDDARNQLAAAFNDLADAGFTKQQMEAAESLRKTLQLMLLMSCSKCQDDCHDLSDTVLLKPVRLGKGQ